MALATTWKLAWRALRNAPLDLTDTKLCVSVAELRQVQHPGALKPRALNLSVAHALKDVTALAGCSELHTLTLWQ